VANNVQHNDVHPGNIGIVFTSNMDDFLVSGTKGSFGIKLLDFGLSELMRSKDWKTKNRAGMPTISAPYSWQHRSFRVKLFMHELYECMHLVHALAN
jgi:serine/threonine protein kinase